MQLARTHNPSEQDVGFTHLSTPPIAFRAFKKNELMLFPYSPEVLARKPEGAAHTTVSVSVGGGRCQKLFLLKPEGVFGGGKGGGRSQTRIYPFWNAALPDPLAGPEEEPVSELQYQKLTLKGYLQLQTEKPGKAKNQSGHEQNYSTSTPRVELSVWYLTNDSSVMRGSSLQAAPAETIVQPCMG